MSPGPARGRSAGPADGPGTTGQGGRVGAPRRWRLVRASPEAVPPSVRRFMRRARQRRLRAALPWTVVAGLLLLAGLGVWAVYGTGLFGVRQVRVVGTALVTPEQVRAAAAVPDGEPLARVDLAEVRRRVGALPPVARVTVSRDWPGTLLVEVVERIPTLVVPDGQRFLVLDAAGVVFRTVPARPAGVPLARITRPGPDDAATRAGLRVVEALTPELRDALAELVVAGPAQVRLKLADGRTVVWGDASQGETKARVATSLLGRSGDTIDVSAPDVVTIR